MRLAVITIALSLTSACTQPPAAPDEATRLISELKAASGGPALDKPAGFHETGTVLRDGATGTYEVWADLHTLRNVASHTLGGRSVSSGFDGQKAWAVDPDGTVRTDTSPQGLASARLGTYLTTFGFFYPDRFPARFEFRGRKDASGQAYDVVTVTPADSLPADLWLDAKTHRLQRITGTDGTTAFAGVVNRYDVVDGIWIPFALSQTEGEHQMTQELNSVVFGPVPPERFAPPSN